MATVQRANVVLKVSDSAIDRYLAKGFSLIDEKGNILKPAKPTTLEQYKKAYTEQRRINNDLVQENEKLKSEIAQLKSKPKKPKTTAKAE